MQLVEKPSEHMLYKCDLPIHSHIPQRPAYQYVFSDVAAIRQSVWTVFHSRPSRRHTAGRQRATCRHLPHKFFFNKMQQEMRY